MAGILIVDDDALIRTSLRRFLQPDHEVFEAGDGLEALDRLREHPIDLVLVDVAMPNMSGIELLHQMKTDYPGKKVVLMSAFDDVIDLAERESSVVRSLHKPFTLDQMQAAVLAAIA